MGDLNESPAMLLEADNETSQMVADYHIRAAQLYTIVRGLAKISMIVWAIYLLAAYNIRIHSPGLSMTDTDLAACREAILPGLPHGDRFCVTYIAWYENELALWILIPQLLSMVIGIVLSLDIIAARSYEPELSKNRDVSFWTRYKLTLGINSSVNAIELHAVNPRMHLERLFDIISVFGIFSAIATAQTPQNLALAVLAGIAYSFSAICASKAGHRSRDGLGRFIAHWVFQGIVLIIFSFTVWFYNARVYIYGAEHYTAVVFWNSIIFVGVMFTDLFWDLATIIVRDGVTKMSSQKTITLKATSQEYSLIDGSAEITATDTFDYKAQPLLVAAFVSNWVRGALFEIFVLFTAFFAPIYFISKGIPIVI